MIACEYEVLKFQMEKDESSNEKETFFVSRINDYFWSLQHIKGIPV